MNQDSDTAGRVATPSEPWSAGDKILLAVACLAALLPRIWAPGVAFSPREAAAMLMAGHDWSTLLTLLEQGADRFVPVNLRFIPIVKAWSVLAGEGEFAMRLLPLALGLAALAAGYAAARQILDRRASLIALLLLCINPYLVVMSRTLGHESLLLALCSVAIYAFLRICNGRGGAWGYALYTVSFLAAILFHFIPAVLIIPFFAVFFTVREKRAWDIPAWLIANAPVIALFAVSMPEWRALSTANLGFAKDSHFMELYDPRLLSSAMQFNIVFLEKYVNAFFTLSAFFPGAVYRKLNGFDALALFAVLPAFHVAIFYGLREYAHGLRARVFLVLTLFTVCALGAGATFFGFSYREGLIPAYLAFSIVVAGGVHRFGGARLKTLFAAALLLLFLGGWASVRADEKVSADWRPVAREIRESAPPGVQVFALDGWGGSALSFYMKQDRDRLELMFPDFAPIDVPGSNKYLSGIIIEPFHGRVFAYDNDVENAVEEQGQAWLVVQARNDDDPPHIDEVRRWVRSARENGIISVEERRFNTGSSGPRTAIEKDLDSARLPVILMRVRATAPADAFRHP
jgi:hypothetical protein